MDVMILGCGVPSFLVRLSTSLNQAKQTGKADQADDPFPFPSRGQDLEIDAIMLDLERGPHVIMMFSRFGPPMQKALFFSKPATRRCLCSLFTTLSFEKERRPP